MTHARLHETSPDDERVRASATLRSQSLTRQRSPSDVIVVGGGAIGLAVAWRAARRGLGVTLLERRQVGGGASWVAAGMLAPVTEARLTEIDLLELGIASAAAYPAFVEELRTQTDIDVGYQRCGTLVVARDRDDAEALERELEVRLRLGLGVSRLRPSRARALEPALAPTVRLALAVDDDHAIDPRRLTDALALAARHCGVTIRTGAEVAELRTAGGHVAGVVLADGERVSAEHVVLASGAWTSGVRGLPEGAQVPIHPVKGQLMRLRDPAGPGLFARVLRTGGSYLVPRGDGRYVLGATMEERGFDTSVTAGAVFELLRDVIELVPGASELVIDELIAGLRPATPDGLPAVGPGGLDGLHWAVGHYRNGILLAPITAEIVLAGLQGEEPPQIAAPFAPSRFHAVSVGA
jgi:glycine oxidase